MFADYKLNFRSEQVTARLYYLLISYSANIEWNVLILIAFFQKKNIFPPDFWTLSSDWLISFLHQSVPEPWRTPS